MNEALNWWKSQNIHSQIAIMIKNKECIECYPYSDIESLSNSEILKLYQKEEK